ncbi:uncharacterized protein LOC117645503 [Thrips palmi]|uniref:Uncharacterized protein LOC117645503 n=1 Tax=Thrips palmi TaxID=161013 RepID=A0A6P8YVY2_THRPL|nr:uncharacterized protein LOC117645503 [Thrips palmi]
MDWSTGRHRSRAVKIRVGAARRACLRFETCLVRGSRLAVSTQLHIALHICSAEADVWACVDLHVKTILHRFEVSRWAPPSSPRGCGALAAVAVVVVWTHCLFTIDVMFVTMCSR